MIPVAMVGTFEFMPSGQTRPNFRIRPGVRFGEPLDFSRFYGKALDRHVQREVTDVVMQAIEKLSGQEYVDMYAQQAKEKLAAAAGQLPTAPRPRAEPPETPPETKILRPGRRTPPGAKVAP